MAFHVFSIKTLLDKFIAMTMLKKIYLISPFQIYANPKIREIIKFEVYSVYLPTCQTYGQFSGLKAESTPGMNTVKL